MKHRLSKLNLILMAVSFIVILVGLLLTAGEPSGEVDNPDLFWFRRITVGPMHSSAGFVLMIIAILVPSKKL